MVRKIFWLEKNFGRKIFWSEKKFGQKKLLVRCKNNMMFLAVIQSKSEEVVEENNIMGKEKDIVSLSNRGDLDRSNINPKVGFISRGQLFRVVDCIEVPRSSS